MDEKEQLAQQHNYSAPSPGVPPAYQDPAPSNYNQYGGHMPSLQYAQSTGPTAVVVTGQPNTATTIVTGQPTSVVDQYFSSMPRNWTTGLCNCCADCKICLCASCCHMCYSGALAMKLDENCISGCCFAPLRTKFRMKHNIQGSVCEDACLSYYCNPCVVCQMGREMNALHYETKCGCC